MIRKVGLVVKSMKSSLDFGKKINAYLTSKGIETFIDDWSASKMGLKHKECKIDDMNVDLIVTLGGDGTILKTVALIAGKKIPIFGINFGTMGFLTEIRPPEWKASIDKILSGKYDLYKAAKLDAYVGKKKVGEALNEAVVMTSMPVKMLQMEVYIGDQLAENVRADGIIVATPTGSTAYSMSAGGPIIGPGIPALTITSICPFKSGVRSLVVSQDSRIKVKLVKPEKKAMVVIDGEYEGKLTPGEEVEFRLSKNKAYFVRLEGDFYDRVRERL